MKFVLAIVLAFLPMTARAATTFSTTESVIQYGPVAPVTGTTNGSAYISGQRAELWQPAPTAGQWQGPYPVIYLFHGGGWNSGTSAYDSYEANVWASNGYVVLNADYRLQTAPGGTAAGCTAGCAPWPAQLIDIQLLQRYVTINASSLHVSPGGPQICKGDSAGASLCMQLAFYAGTYQTSDPSSLMYTCLQSYLTAVIDEFGPTEASAPNNLNQPYVLALATVNGKNVRAAMTIQGTADTSVPPSNTTDLNAALTALNVPVNYVSYVGGHEYSGLTNAQITTIRNSEVTWAQQQMLAVGLYWMQ